MKKDSLENILFKELCNPVSRSFRCNLLDKTLQHCTRTALCEVRSTIGNHVLHCLRPTYRCCQLSHQVLLDFYRVSMRHSVYILIYGALRSMDSCCIDGCFQFNLAGSSAESGTHRLPSTAEHALHLQPSSVRKPC